MKSKNQKAVTMASDDDDLQTFVDKIKIDNCKYRGCSQKDFGPHKHYLVSFINIFEKFW